MARIILADDDNELREILTQYLRLRWDVTAVTNGQSVLEEVAKERPALVVLDVVMPRMNGLEVVEHLRADPAYADLPICMMTASTRGSDTHDSVWRMASDTDAFITKPFEPAELMAKVEKLLLTAAKRRRER